MITDEQLQSIVSNAEVQGRIKAKIELIERINDLHRPVEIVAEVLLWLKEKDEVN